MNYVSALDIVLFHSMLIACPPLLASEYIQIILLCKIQVFQFNGEFLRPLNPPFERGQDPTLGIVLW